MTSFSVTFMKLVYEMVLAINGDQAPLVGCALPWQDREGCKLRD